MNTVPITFVPYLNWVDVTDPNNIPPGTRRIGGSDLLRYERGLQDVVGRSNSHSALLDAVAVPVAENATVRVLTCPSLSRPSAGALGPGACIFDTDLKRPLWSDGDQWLDSAGNPAPPAP